MKDSEVQSLFFHMDVLTGCSNLVSFSKSMEVSFENEQLAPLSLIVIEVYQLRDINLTKGFDYGDSVLRWMGIAIKDETGATVYRLSGNNFIATLMGKSHAEHQAIARRLFDRLNGEARQLDLATPVVRMAVIHFPAGVTLNPAVVWKNLNEKLELTSVQNPFQVFDADTSETDEATLHAIQLMAKRIETFGTTLQYTFRLAYTDPVSQSPNMIAI